MSPEDKVKLDNLSENTYTHPRYEVVSPALKKIGRDSTGHVVIGLDVAKKDIVDLGIPGQDTTYDIADSTNNGLMSAADKQKLDSITIASKFEAEYGIDNTKIMTPLRVRQVIERYNYVDHNELSNYATIEALDDITGLTGGIPDFDSFIQYD